MEDLKFKSGDQYIISTDQEEKYRNLYFRRAGMVQYSERSFLTCAFWFGILNPLSFVG